MQPQLSISSTVHGALSLATARLIPVSDAARLEAEVLLSHCLNKDRAWAAGHPDWALDALSCARFETLVGRRRAGEPIAYITGRREFWSLDLCVTPDTLIPRPETELLVEQALVRIPVDANWEVADLGTGCGAIAVAVARERCGCRIVATDVSHTALAVARHNAAHLCLGNVEFVCGDWLRPFRAHRFDMLVANPPYVADCDPHLKTGDLPFEPRLALAAGAAGMDALGKIIAGARRYLRPGGWLVLEHGFDQGPLVTALMRDHGATGINTYLDYAHHERVSACQVWSAGASIEPLDSDEC